ncbi:MAG: hypothetical protein ACI8QQ_002811 [Psychroserpens sp.]|jgi:hypothetical protein
MYTSSLSSKVLSQAISINTLNSGVYMVFLISDNNCSKIQKSILP